MKKHFGCPVQATSNVLAGKWKVLIVWHLSFGQRRFAEIRDLLPGVSEKVLAAQLRELERDGVINRVATQGVPRRVDYMLSNAGEELVPVMEAMCSWGTKHLGVEPTLPRSALAPAATKLSTQYLGTAPSAGDPEWSSNVSGSAKRHLPRHLPDQ